MCYLCLEPLNQGVYAVILTSAGWRNIYQEAICQLFANFPIGSSSAGSLVTLACLCILLQLAI
jgi:hypothetical protein